ncbi:PTS sugar transporter subunit IIB [Bombilactobacillus thymidiniphilus]|uniref:PTS sugar transporter subunit IIB n=1 Tax=Bombilactobacillus thymidiniphilus TaxID=2923363 RepID=A0ABY4PF88_9LACO|nr:PTS sugar transporter subunit IIB [Bombilactobacillus thymidiniphilus]UQS84186.1 PTS sugar transporter subunit IIB [Bombilactobacillus thymidiniphilus]
MSVKKIMLVCAAGMSTSLLVSKMQQAAKDQGIEAEIFATAVADADNQLETQKPDVLMLGPQVSYMLNEFKDKVDIPVEVINMQDYGMMNGTKVLTTALKLING